MSFLLDPPALLLLGFLVSKVNYLTVVFDNRFLRRGNSRRYILIFGVAFTALFWAYSALLYVNVIYFPWPFPKWFGGSDWMLNSGLPFGLARSSTSDILGVVIFATYPLWFLLGAEFGVWGDKIGNSRRLKERDRIIKELLSALFPKGGAIPPGADDVDSAGGFKELLTKIPPNFSDSLTMLLFVFDSRFFVLAFTGKWKRFVDLDGDSGSTVEKRKYVEALNSNPFLITVIQILKIAAGYGYFTKALVYKSIGYAGPLIPNEPPWYNPGPTGPQKEVA
jgi:hypothetical protein